MLAIQDVRVIHQQICSWYDAHGRKQLPWRLTSNPYHVYLSEVMLQQTQVKTVLDKFYAPFLLRFPTLLSVAQANKEDILQQWQGLGYYNRAINLWNTAQLTQGQLPSSIEALTQLPGIGQNTAHAIACFAFGQAVPILEANVRRILARFYAIEHINISELWRLSNLLLNKDDAFIHNQALMDIGSSICTPKEPACYMCPLSQACQGRHHPHQYPNPTPTKATPIRFKKILILCDSRGYVYLQQRHSRFLNGLFQFLEFEQDETLAFNRQPIELNLVTFIGKVQQTYSHFQLHAEIFLCNLHNTSNENSWYSQEQMNTLPVSKAETKIIALLKKHMLLQ
ncbi:MAG: A/G-specific adenine glycosylase [Alphaproteobacteria bacterium]|nr:A/G-specific adenine glycosylase [Alphaproteobacteria bacterium]